MIVKMKQVTILVSEPHIEEALKKLRTLGVLHIIKKGQLAGNEVSDREDRLGIVLDALSAIKDIKPDSEKNCDLDKAQFFLEQINNLTKRKQFLAHELNKINEILIWYNEWGQASLASIEILKEAGVFVALYKLDRNSFRKIKNDNDVYLISGKNNSVYVAVISKDNSQKKNIGERVELPKKEYSILKNEHALAEREIEDINSKIKEYSSYKKVYLKYKAIVQKELEFYSVKSCMSSEKEFSYIKGFCPCYNVSKILNTAQSRGWGVFVQEPENKDAAPVLLKNNRFTRIIQPLFRFIETLPGYNEYDASLWFLLFFSLFFAMIIGDAGYGFLFLGITGLIQRKMKVKRKDVIFLLYLLSFATIVWGAVTGTWFGYQDILKLKFFNFFAIERINSFVESNHNFMIKTCFIIGIVHLTIAHLIEALRSLKDFRFLSHFGWIGVGWGMFFVASNIVLNTPLPKSLAGFMSLGIALICLFSNPQKNIFKSIIFTIVDLPLKIIGFFADILSYLRLFAVGYASVMVASSFNNLALSIGFNNILSGLGAGLLLFLGHALNIMLGLMSVLVHGLRLNMLEFSSHINLQWKGQKYDPFRE